MGCDPSLIAPHNALIISTHTSRVGCDCKSIIFWPFPANFYSHIPCGMWPVKVLPSVILVIFLLTHPVWDVTKTERYFKRCSNNFYSHIPCGMWRLNRRTVIHQLRISTHTSRVGCDTFDKSLAFGISNFYSHIPCGMWQGTSELTELSFDISTHTSRVGCDLH